MQTAARDVAGGGGNGDGRFLKLVLTARVSDFTHLRMASLTFLGPGWYNRKGLARSLPAAMKRVIWLKR